MQSILYSAFLGLVFLPVAIAQAQSISYTNAFPGATFSRPVFMAEVPGKPNKFAVVEQPGRIQIVSQNGASWAKAEFTSVTVTGGSSGGSEQGLLGLAFHPKYAENRKYYVMYCTSNANVVAEGTADSTLLKDSGTPRRVLLSISDSRSNHNGGTIHFGPKDGFLYIGTGDGGGGGDPDDNGQDKNELLAKILRIDVNSQAGGKQYAIPSDNPFAQGGGAPEVWAFGLRNPFRWSFDPLNGDLWVGDVGQGSSPVGIEEVSIVKKGGNYGWNTWEGTQCYPSGGTGCSGVGFEKPLYSYKHGAQGNCITGGVVYRGIASSSYYGTYIFGDYGSDNMWSLTSAGQATALPDPPNLGIAGFASDAGGQIYVMGINNSAVFRIQGLGPTTSIYVANRLTEKTGKTFLATPGERLHLQGSWTIFSLEGSKMAALSTTNPMVPAELKAGIYLLRDEGKLMPHLLVVR